MTHLRNRFAFLCAPLAALAMVSCGSGGGPVEPEDTTPQPGHVYNWAGTGQAGYGAMGLAPTKTRLYWPQDVTVAPDGTPYVLDWNNHRVIALVGGQFRLIVGVSAADFGDPCPDTGPCEDILAVQARLNHPTGVAIDPNTGHLILAAWHNSALFSLDLATGLMDRLCGDGTRCYNGDGQPAIDAYVDLPVAVAFDSQGRLCFADQANMVVRMIDEDGIIHTIAGTPPTPGGGTDACPWTRHYGFEGDGGPATSARLFLELGQAADPSGRISFDGDGNMYIADSQNHCVRVVDTGGIIHRFAGNGSAGYSGDDGDALLAQLTEPRDIVADADGSVYIADTGNHVIRRVDTAGVITTVVGRYRGSGPGIPPISATRVREEHGLAARQVTLTNPYGLEIDPQGRLLIVDTFNHVIRIYYP